MAIAVNAATTAVTTMMGVLKVISVRASRHNCWLASHSFTPCPLDLAEARRADS